MNLKLHYGVKSVAHVILVQSIEENCVDTSSPIAPTPLEGRLSQPGYYASLGSLQSFATQKILVIFSSFVRNKLNESLTVQPISFARDVS